MALIAASLLGVVIAVAAIIITVRTKHGEVVIELNDPTAKVAVQVDGERIDVSGLDKPLTLTVGEHDLTVKGPGFETETKSFTVKNGKNPVLKMTLKPKEKSGNQASTNPSSVKLGTKKGEVITNSIGIKLAYIPPGTFSMGSPKDELGRGEDEDEHDVEITKGFYLGVYEVTQGEYEKVMGENPSFFSAKGDAKSQVPEDTNRFPVEQVFYEDAVKFCAKLSEMEKGIGRLYRLPTEAEWEYACRGGATSKAPFHYGKSISSDQANFNGKYPYGGTDEGLHLGRTCKVGSYKPNGYGLYDMHGNVWEWCSDWYSSDYYANGPKRNPLGPSKGSTLVIRGGGWYDVGRGCRSAGREDFVPSNRHHDLGFRVALAASGQE
jgi:formylglycine-generating enzyme required for sulfatase activity